MNTRFVLALTFGGLSIAMIVGGVVLESVADVGAQQWQTALIGTLGNLGAEIGGVALTVGIIDWLMERRRLNEQAAQMGWRMLHDLDHAFWVWQGGRREFHLDELVALLDLAKPSDPMPRFTQELFINLGIRAADNMRLQPRIVGHKRPLKIAMKSLTGLAQIREAAHLDASYVIQGLKEAVGSLAELTGQRAHPGEFGAAKSFRDASEEAQQTRYRGSIQTTMGDPTAMRVGSPFSPYGSSGASAVGVG